MSAIIWATSPDGLFEYVSLTKATLQGAMEVMSKAFFLHENVSIAVELHKYPKAIKELEELCLRAARDGVSIVAIEKKTGKVAAAAFNKLQVPALPGEENYFENFAANCKEASSKSLVRFMIEADAECDLFKECGVDCLLEVMFLATLSEYRGKGLGKQLFQSAIAIGKKLLSGENVKVPINDDTLPLTIAPRVVSAICTSFITQKIARSLKFTKAVEIEFNKWSFDGKTYGERIGPETPTTTLDYYKL